ncbi:MAG: hypothetical protein AB1921_16840 [Thermodesulfobacteriota bacterium]
MADHRQIVLDDEAEALFRDLGGLDSKKGMETISVADSLHDEEKKKDAYRLLLGDLASGLSEVFSLARANDRRAFQEKEKGILLALEKLAKMPKADGRILIRFRGRPSPEQGTASRTFDYVIFFGPLALDVPTARKSAHRLGVTAAEFPVKLQEAFEKLGRHDVVSLYLHISTFGPEERALFQKGLLAILDYEAAVSAGENPEDRFPYLVKDESRLPDPNLSALATVNALKPETAAELVKKIRMMMLKAVPGDPMEQFVSVYDAIFAFPKLRDQLKRPPVEVNNPRWLMAVSASEAVGLEKVKLTRLMSLEFGKHSAKTARVLDCIYGNDYGKIDAPELEDRLTLISELIAAVEKNVPRGIREPMEADLQGRMTANLDIVADDVFDGVTIKGGMVVARGSEGRVRVRQMSPFLLAQVDFFQQRSLTREKMKSLLHRNATFDDDDYKTVARDFGITVEDAQKLVSLIAGSFDQRGKFLRRAFEKIVPELAKHDRKVFEFLWHYLKELMDRQDRVAFLNAMQLLIDQMKARRQGVAVLLSDFIRDPETVTFSDRNALMLATLLLRKYNKELHTDIEVTPEEVLLVKEGLDAEVTKFAEDFISERREEFLIKLRTLHRALKDALDPYDPAKALPVRYAMTLEREVYIFLSLVGGKTAATVLRSALSEYGDPEAEVYWMRGSEQSMQGLLATLQVLVRGAGRSSYEGAAEDLRGIERKQNKFLSMGKTPRHADQVRRLLTWVDKAVDEARRGEKEDIAFHF